MKSPLPIARGFFCAYYGIQNFGSKSKLKLSISDHFAKNKQGR